MRISVRVWAGLSIGLAIMMVTSEGAIAGVEAGSHPGVAPALTGGLTLLGGKARPLSATLPEFPDNLTHFVYIVRENHDFDDYLGDCSLTINDTCNGGVSYSSTSTGTATETSASGNQLRVPNTHALAREYAVFDNMYSSVDAYSAQGHNYLFTANVWGGTDSCSNTVEGTGSTTQWGIYNNSNVKSGSCGWNPDLGSQSYSSSGGSILDRFLGPNVPQSKTTLPFLSDGDNVWELSSPGCSVTASRTIPGDSLNSVQVVTGCTNGYWMNTTSGKADMPPTVNPTTGIPQFLWECQFASGCGSTAPSTFLDSYAANSFTAFLADYGLPTYTQVELQDDHPGSYCGQTDAICVQWNDAAVSTVVSAIENSTTYSKNTVIAISEDDTQDGANGMDHVNSGRRLPFVVVAPHTVMKSGGAPATCGISSSYPSCGLVIHQTFNTSNVLSVMERVEMNVDPNILVTGGISPNNNAFPMVENDYLAEGNPLEPLWKCGQPGVPCNTGSSGGGNPSITSFTAQPTSISLGATEYLNVSATGGTPGYTYSYSGLPTGCSSANTATYSCIPTATGSATVTVTVTDSASKTVTGTASFTVTSGSTLAVSSFTALPVSIPLGGTIYLNTTATGGSSPYSYIYTGLPPGCTTSSVAAYTCVPSSAGSYTATVTVTDAASNTASKSASFSVNSGSSLAVSSFTALPASIPLGGTIYLNATATGGTSPYTYVYTGLPAGCTTQSTAMYTCVPTSASSYTVTVTVTDSASATATGTASFSVTSPGGPSISTFTAAPSTLYVGDTLYLNTTATGGTSPYNYVYNNLPAGCSSTSSSAYTCQPTTAGTYSAISVTVTDNNLLSITSGSHSVTVFSLPSISSFSVQPASIPLGGTTYVNTTVAGGSGTNAYSFSGLPSGCASSNPSFSCVPSVSGTFSIRVQVTDNGGRSASSSAASLQVTAPAGYPSITAFTASPSTISLGGTSYINVTATGGTPPYSFSYTGLPSGCSSANSAQLTCVPAATGTFPLSVLVTDGASHTASSSTPTLTVSPAANLPSITAFAASPSSIPFGGTTYLNVSASGGTAPYTYSYSGLPQGCSSLNEPILICSPSTSGTVTVKVTVTDASSASASSSTTFTVQASASTSAGQTPWLEYAAIGAIAALALAIAVILATRKKGAGPIPPAHAQFPMYQPPGAPPF